MTIREQVTVPAKTENADDGSDIVALARSVGLPGFSAGPAAAAAPAAAANSREIASKHPKNGDDGSDIVALARSVGLPGFSAAPVKSEEKLA